MAAPAIAPETSRASALTMIPLLRIERFITLRLRRFPVGSRGREESGGRALDHFDSAIRTADSAARSMTIDKGG
ncbi:hypothetical protein Mro03_26360 [Microbispora rosea subsp. rosea]|nr:hypothetical protein Mro03_26360 [Microbispora rosea subsp. rosea]